MYIGPRIKQKNIVFAVDAGSFKSYNGSGTIWYDLSSSINNAELVGSPTLNNTSGKFFTFNGSSQYASPASITLGNGDVAWAASAWIKTSTTADGLGAGSVLSNTSGGPVYSMMGVNAGKIVYWTYYSAAWQKKLGVGTTVNDNAWHMLTWVNYSNSTMDMYVDGVLDSNVANSTSGNNNPINMIGASWAAYFNGSISQVLIYKNATLTATEVKNLYDATKYRYASYL